MKTNLLVKLGKAVLPIIGPIHDFLASKLFSQGETVLTSEQLQANDGNEQTAQAGTFVNTAAFYIGGTITLALLGVGVSMLIKRSKRKAWGAKMKAARMRSRRKKATTPRRRFTRKRK